MYRLSHLNALHALEVAVRCGSLKEAAKELSITPAALGQRIKSLEDYLGAPLLHRASTGIEPTAILIEAQPSLASAFDSLSVAAKILKLESNNKVTVFANEDFFDYWLKPRLKRFRKSCPHIDLEVVTKRTREIFNADVVIDFIKTSDERQDILFHEYIVPIGTPGNCQRLSSLPKGDELEGFPLLHLDIYKIDSKALSWPSWLKTFGHRSKGATRGTRYDSFDSAIKAATSGAGFLLSGLALAYPLIQKGKLKPPFNIQEGRWTRHAYSMSVNLDASKRPQVQQLRNWILREADQTLDEIQSFLAST